MDKFKKTIFYLKKYYWLSIIIFLFVLFGSFLEMFGIGMMVPIIQGVLGNAEMLKDIPGMSSFNTLFKGWNKTDLMVTLLAIYFLAVSIKHMVFYFGNLTTNRQRFLLTRDLQVDLYDKLMKCGVKFYDSTKSGYIINSLYNESTRIGNYINCVLRILAQGIRFLAHFVILFIISWQVTLLAILIFGFILVPISFIVKRIREIGVLINNAVAEFNFRVLETISGIRVIHLFSSEDYERQRFRQVADELYKYNYAHLNCVELTSPIMQIMFMGSFLALFMAIIKFTTVDIVKIVPYMFIYLYVSMSCLAELKALNDLRAEAASHLGAFDSYEEFLSKAVNAIMKNGSRTMSSFRKEIKFEAVSFGYSHHKMIINDLSFNIPKGKSVAIVGASGAGKTTIINLLLRLYDVDQGRITVDGTDLRDLEVGSWREKIGVVSQDVFIFNASARDNISYGKEGVSDEQITRAAKIAEIDEYLCSLPEGYNTIFGEKGVKLSGGQKQRLSIARAVIHNPEILILDEATSSLDTKTERQIQRALDELLKNRTAVIIAHRLSTIINADNLIVMEKGAVVEQGDHEQLLSLNGYYAKLHKMQAA